MITETDKFFPFDNDDNYYFTIRKIKNANFIEYKIIEYINGVDNGDFLIGSKSATDNSFRFDWDNMYAIDKDELIDGIIKFAKHYHNYDLKKSQIVDFIEF